MDAPQHPSRPTDGFPGPLTPEKVQRARARTAAIHEDLRQQGLDFSQLPDPVEELIKVREAGYRDL